MCQLRFALVAFVRSHTPALNPICSRSAPNTGAGFARGRGRFFRRKRMPSLFETRVRATNLYVMTLLAVIIFVGSVGWAGPGSSPMQVSQRGRDFQPNQISIQRGDTLRIVNDDADLLHHAYVSSEKFNFDSNDIEPGGKVDIKFPVAGDFN